MDSETRVPSPDAVLDALRRILAAPEFGASERNRAFLKYVVEETLEGRGARIKAYAIATTVFGRDPSFDPQLDSIVRIEAGRLRRSLEHYYLTAGLHDLVRIALPRGSYVPSFRFAGNEERLPAPAAPRRGTRRPWLWTMVVMPFDEDGVEPPLVHFSRGLTRQVIVALTRFSDLCVLGADALSPQERDKIAADRMEKPEVDFVLTGGVTVTGESFALDVMLMEASTGRYVWAEHFHQKFIASEILALRDEVANRIASTLAQPYGVIFSNKARDAAGRPPELLNSYECVLRFYQYRRNFDSAACLAILADLERVIRLDPLYAEAFACLSLAYSDAHRFRYALPDPTIDPQQRALRLAHRSIELAPNSSLGHHALGNAYWFGGDACSGLVAFEAARRLNPNDTDLLADLGFRYACLGRWDEAMPLLEEAFMRNPALPGTQRTGIALYHYVHGRYEQALAEARKIQAPTVPYISLLIAAAAAQLGLHWEAEHALGQVLQLDPRYGDRIVSDLTARHIHSDTIRVVLEGLRKAGLTGREMEDGPSLVRGPASLAGLTASPAAAGRMSQ